MNNYQPQARIRSRNNLQCKFVSEIATRTLKPVKGQKVCTPFNTINAGLQLALYHKQAYMVIKQPLKLVPFDL